jgi:hypothetical protein
VECFHRYLEFAYVPPTFQPNNSSPNCPLCSSTFSITNSRHHCRYFAELSRDIYSPSSSAFIRNCGTLVCGKCSSHFIPIPKFYYNESVRVCDNCFRGTLLPPYSRFFFFFLLVEIHSYLLHSELSSRSREPTLPNIHVVKKTSDLASWKLL